MARDRITDEGDDDVEVIVDRHVAPRYKFEHVPTERGVAFRCRELETIASGEDVESAITAARDAVTTVRGPGDADEAVLVFVDEEGAMVVVEAANQARRRKTR